MLVRHNHDLNHFLDIKESKMTQPQPAPYTAGQEVEVEMADGKWYKGAIDHEYNGILYMKYAGNDYPVAISHERIRPVQVQPEMPEWEIYWREQLRRLIKAYQFDDNGQQRAIDSMIKKLRPLITPKQVTDEEIVDKWEVFREYDILVVAAIKLVRYFLQKAEGGEG